MSRVCWVSLCHFQSYRAGQITSIHVHAPVSPTGSNKILKQLGHYALRKHNIYIAAEPTPVDVEHDAQQIMTALIVQGHKVSLNLSDRVETFNDGVETLRLSLMELRLTDGVETD